MRVPRGGNFVSPRRETRGANSVRPRRLHRGWGNAPTRLRNISESEPQPDPKHFGAGLNPNPDSETFRSLNPNLISNIAELLKLRNIAEFS